jgi:hypothetical protein
VQAKIPPVETFQKLRQAGLRSPDILKATSPEEVQSFLKVTLAEVQLLVKAGL